MQNNERVGRQTILQIDTDVNYNHPSIYLSERAERWSDGVISSSNNSSAKTGIQFIKCIKTRHKCKFYEMDRSCETKLFQQTVPSNYKILTGYRDNQLPQLL